MALNSKHKNLHFYNLNFNNFDRNGVVMTVVLQSFKYKYAKVQKYFKICN